MGGEKGGGVCRRRTGGSERDNAFAGKACLTGLERKTFCQKSEKKGRLRGIG